MLRLPSIRSKLLAIFLVAGVLPITLVSLISYRNSLRAVEHMVGNRTYRLALSVEEELSKKLAKQVNDRLITDNVPLQDYLITVFDDPPEKHHGAAVILTEYLNELFEEYGAYYDQVLIADQRKSLPVYVFSRTEGARSVPNMTFPRTRNSTTAESDPVEVAFEFGKVLSQLVELGKDWEEPSDEPPDESAADSTRSADYVPPGLEPAALSKLNEKLAKIMSGEQDEAIQVSLMSSPQPAVVRQLQEGDLSPENIAAAKSGRGLERGEFRLFTDRSGAGGSRVLRLVRPVYSVDDPDRQVGTIVGTFRGNYIFPDDLGTRRFGEAGELSVVDVKTGELLFHTNPTDIGKPLGRTDPRLLEALDAEMDRSPDGVIEAPFTKVAGESGIRLASAIPLSTMPWGVIATALPKEFEGETRRAGLYNLLVASLALLVAGTVLLFASGRISHSLQILTRGAREIAAGNLNHEITVQTHDEIETLGETFNMMTASLRESIALREKAAEELADLNRMLEDRVEERTHELRSVNRALNDANRELTELDRLKTNFLHTVSHELRTPLTSITAFSEILLDETDELNVPTEVTRFLGIIHTESERLGRLIKNLLDLARIESGRIQWAVDRFRAGEVIQSALDGLLPVFAEKDIVVATDIRCAGAMIEADRDRVQQVIANLLENAVKFSSKGANLWLDCAEQTRSHGSLNGDEERRWVRVSVRDEGPGIPKDSIERIFERFHQVDNSETRAAGGTGLGLAISKEIIEHHQGHIWAESRVGEGTTFHFTLPIAAAAPAPEGAGATPAEEEKHA